jgi:hypothetical protein
MKYSFDVCLNYGVFGKKKSWKSRRGKNWIFKVIRVDLLQWTSMNLSWAEFNELRDGGKFLFEVLGELKGGNFEWLLELKGNGNFSPTADVFVTLIEGSFEWFRVCFDAICLMLMRFCGWDE